MDFKATLIQLLEQLIFILQQWLPGGGTGVIGWLIKVILSKLGK